MKSIHPFNTNVVGGVVQGEQSYINLLEWPIFG